MKPEVIKFTRRDRNETASSQITNQKVIARAVECSVSPFTNEFMVCAFEDDVGTRKEIRNIVFTNFDVPKPKFTTYKQSDSGEIVQKVNFNIPAVCEVLGHNHIGLTMNCYSASREKIATSKFESDDIIDMNVRNRGGGYGL